MNTLLQIRPVLIAPHAMPMSKVARAWVLLASLAIVAVSVNAAIILASGA
jgi:hypothetical protein